VLNCRSLPSRMLILLSENSPTLGDRTRLSFDSSPKLSQRTHLLSLLVLTRIRLISSLSFLPRESCRPPHTRKPADQTEEPTMMDPEQPLPSRASKPLLTPTSPLPFQSNSTTSPLKRVVFLDLRLSPKVTRKRVGRYWVCCRWT
jgi:hypothetical protein